MYAIRSYYAVVQAGQDDIAFSQRTVLYQDGGDRTAPFIQTGFDHHTLCRRVFDRFQLKHFGLQQHLIQQVVDPLTGFRRNVGELHIAAPVFGDNVALRQFALDSYNFV